MRTLKLVIGRQVRGNVLIPGKPKLHIPGGGTLPVTRLTGS